MQRVGLGGFRRQNAKRIIVAHKNVFLHIHAEGRVQVHLMKVQIDLEQVPRSTITLLSHLALHVKHHLQIVLVGLKLLLVVARYVQVVFVRPAVREGLV